MGKFGAFSFPYKAMECGPDLKCIAANTKCMADLQGAASAAKKAADEVQKKYSAAQVAKATSDKKKKAAVASALKKYEQAKMTHMNAVANHKGAHSTASHAYEDWLKLTKAHCNAEAKHAEAVLKIGHPQLKTTNCKKPDMGR